MYNHMCTFMTIMHICMYIHGLKCVHGVITDMHACTITCEVHNMCMCMCMCMCIFMFHTVVGAYMVMHVYLFNLQAARLTRTSMTMRPTYRPLSRQLLLLPHSSHMETASVSSQQRDGTYAPSRQAP